MTAGIIDIESGKPVGEELKVSVAEREGGYVFKGKKWSGLAESEGSFPVLRSCISWVIWTTTPTVLMAKSHEIIRNV
jgi:hypothetical protein